MSYIGTHKVGKMYLGSTAIGKAYLGDDLVYDSAGDAPMPEPILPTGYIECEYIQETSNRAAGAYIDTGVKPTSESRIVAKIENAVDNSEFYPAIFGVRGANNTARFESFAYKTYVHSFTITGSAFGSSYRTTSASAHTIDLNKSRLIYDGVEYQSSSTGTWVSTLNMYIGALNNNGVASGTLPFKLYYFKIYNSDTLLRDFVPAYQQSSQKYGLYDLVTDTFYSSARSGYSFSGLQKS